jgi:hypothetical protein
MNSAIMASQASSEEMEITEQEVEYHVRKTLRTQCVLCNQPISRKKNEAKHVWEDVLAGGNTYTVKYHITCHRSSMPACWQYMPTLGRMLREAEGELMAEREEQRELAIKRENEKKMDEEYIRRQAERQRKVDEIMDSVEGYRETKAKFEELKREENSLKDSIVTDSIDLLEDSLYIEKVDYNEYGRFERDMSVESLDWAQENAQKALDEIFQMRRDLVRVYDEMDLLEPKLTDLEDEVKVRVAAIPE